MPGRSNARAATRPGAPALRFTARFALTLVAGVVAAIIVAPLVAVECGADEQVGRIFSRKVDEHNQRAFLGQPALGAGFLEFVARASGEA